MRNGFEKVFMGAAGSAGGAGLDVDEVFSTYLYEGNGSNTTRSINNGIDLATEGGIIWSKIRSQTGNHVIFDPQAYSNGDHWIYVDLSTAPQDMGSRIFDTTSTGYQISNNNTRYNANSQDYVSWTFRKAPKFFDVVTYSGNGTAGRTVSHNLGSVPGMIMVKRTSSAADWAVYHRGIASDAETDALFLNTAAAAGDHPSYWNDTAPTDAVFSVGNGSEVNSGSGTYVAYLFAHNDGDGGFGPDGDQDIIKCGGYSGNNAGVEIDLGFEAQWFMCKKSNGGDTGTGDWEIFDVMRGMHFNPDTQSVRLSPNTTGAETSKLIIGPSPTGVSIPDATANVNINGGTYVYMAIRRGSLAPPEAATEVFAVSTPSKPVFVSGFAVDMVIDTLKISQGNHISARLTGDEYMLTNDTNAGGGRGFSFFDDHGGLDLGSNWYGTNQAGSIAWMWKRAPGFFDVVAYKGDGTLNQTFSHGLAAKPDMVWIKNRGATQDWWVALDDSIFNLDGRLNNSGDFGYNVIGTFTDTTVQTLNQNQAATNYNGVNYIAYLFATLAGVSKIGSVTHSGTTNVDCGFSAGSRFVLLKRTDATSDWYVWDSVNGIVSGNDPYIQLNASAAQVTGSDFIDPLNAGFTISDNFTDGDYIFYAIA